MKVTDLRDLFAKAIYLAMKDSRGYKYLVFEAQPDPKDPKKVVQINGNNLNVDEVKYSLCTKKVKEIIDTWIAIYDTKRNSDEVKAKNGETTRVELYNVPAGNISKLLNFGGRVGLTVDGANQGESIFTRALDYTGITDDEKLVVDCETLNAHYKMLKNYVNEFNLQTVAKGHAKLDEFSGFDGDGNYVYLSHWTSATYEFELVKLIGFKSPFKLEVQNIAGDVVNIRNSRLSEYLAISLGYGDKQ